MRTVVIVEPHPLFRLGLRQLLSDTMPQLSIEGYDYSSLEEVPGSPRKKCDLLLLSHTATRCVGKLTTAAVDRFTPVRILLLVETDDMPNTALKLPECVAGSVPRAAPPEILQASVSLVLAGGTCFPAHAGRDSKSERLPLPVNAPADASRYEPARWGSSAVAVAPVLSTIPANGGSVPAESIDLEFSAPIKPGSAAHRESQLLGLTPRQYEVLVLLARGYPMKKVGRALNISVATAKAHTETLYQRLDVHNRNAAVYAAVSRGATLGWAHVMNAQPRPGSS